MISVEEARSLILERARPKAPVRIAAADAMGFVLAKDVSSDIDSPPHDKSLMDGYAVVAADVLEAGAELTVLEEITAGAAPTKSVRRGGAARHHDGRSDPGRRRRGGDGRANGVVGRRTARADPRVGGAPGQNILRRGASFPAGQVVLSAGRVIRPSEIGLLAEVGATRVWVYPRPSVAVMPTGDELTPPDATPSAGQIRNSNGPMLLALVARAGGRAVDVGIGRDDVDHLCSLIRRGLEEDVLVLSGGVSAGVRDLAPAPCGRLASNRYSIECSSNPANPFGLACWPRAAARSSSSDSPAIPSALWSVSSCSSARRWRNWPASD